MTAWLYRRADVAPGDTTTLVLQEEVLKPEYAALTDEEIAAAINAQTEADDSPLNMQTVRRQAIETRFTPVGQTTSRGIWGSLQAIGARVYLDTATAADRQKNDVICACRNFLALFGELEDGAALVRGNTLWNSMDADLDILTGPTGGAPVMSNGQANFMRALGDRTRQKWRNGVAETDVAATRAM